MIGMASAADAWAPPATAWTLVKAARCGREPSCVAEHSAKARNSKSKQRDADGRLTFGTSASFAKLV